MTKTALRWQPFHPWILSLCICFSGVVAGCQSWHTTKAFPGLSEWKQEKKVLERAKHDPFPTPAQVGMK